MLCSAHSFNTIFCMLATIKWIIFSLILFTQFTGVCSVVRIILGRAPLKIIYSVVHRILVLMVYLRQIVWVWNKSDCNKPVNTYKFASIPIV